MPQQNQRFRLALKVLVFLFPITLFFFFLFLKIWHSDVYFLLIQEDSVIEYGQAFFYFLSFAISVFLAAKFLKYRLTFGGVLHGVLAVFFLLVFLEEISWAQRILHIASPGYFKLHNVQNEISLHNLNGVQSLVHKSYMALGVYGAFAWLLPYLPLTKLNWQQDAYLIVPPCFISSYFFFVFFVYGVFDFIVQPRPDNFLQWRDQEPAELLLSMGCLCFVVTHFIELRKYLAISAAKTAKDQANRLL